MNNIVVSVCISTYNHAPFIRECIDSVLSQKLDFDIEILIGEDGSDDGTRDIVYEYELKFPNLIRVFYHDRSNVFYFNNAPTGQNNFLNNLNNAKGKYIALLEGDDYWTDPHKLITQVKYLEENMDAVGCFHNSKLIDRNGNVLKEEYFKSVAARYDQFACLKNLRSSYHTAALMFRSEILEFMPEWLLKRTSDFAFDIFLTEYGYLDYLDFNMSAYRKHAGGIWSGKSHAVNLQSLAMRYKILCSAPELKERYGPYLSKEVNKYLNEAAWLFKNEGNRVAARKVYWSYLKEKKFRFKDIKVFIKHFI